MPQQWA